MILFFPTRTTRQGAARRLGLLGLVIGLAAPLESQAQSSDGWVAKRDVDLLKTPSAQAATAGHVAAQTPLTKTGSRSGPWTQVRSPQGIQGWIHLFDLLNAQQAPSGNTGSSLLRSLSAVNTASQSSTRTSVAGVRGLDAEDITQARPNESAVKQAEQFRASPTQARQFASRAQLKTQAVDELPDVPDPQ